VIAPLFCVRFDNPVAAFAGVPLDSTAPIFDMSSPLAFPSYPTVQQNMEAQQTAPQDTSVPVNNNPQVDATLCFSIAPIVDAFDQLEPWFILPPPQVWEQSLTLGQDQYAAAHGETVAVGASSTPEHPVHARVVPSTASSSVVYPSSKSASDAKKSKSRPHPKITSVHPLPEAGGDLMIHAVYQLQ
jgi:hypothetical protein